MSEDRHFRIKRHFSIIAHSPDVVEFRSGVWNPTSFTLTDEAQSGRLYRLIRRFDSSTSVRTIAREEEASRAEVEALLDHLIELGVVERGATTALDHYLDTCIPSLGLTDAEDSPPPRVLLLGESELTGRISQICRDSLTGVEFATVGEDDLAWQLLTNCDTSWLLDGIDFYERVQTFEKWQGSFLVLATKTVQPTSLRVLNRASLELGLPWMHATMDGPFLFIGPTFIPKRSACFECFETRVMMNIRETSSYQRYKEALIKGQVVGGKQPVLPALASVLASHTALEVINFITTQGNFTIDKVLAIHLPTMEFAFNEILRVPGCAGCGSWPERDDKELYFDMRALLDPS